MRRKLLWLLLAFGWLAQAQTPTVLPAWTKPYEKVRMSDGLYLVSKNGKMGVARPDGHLITRIEFDSIYNFREGIAIVGMGHREVNQFGKVWADFKYGYLNKAGKVILPIQYEFVSSYSEGLGLVTGRDRQYYLDKQGRVAITIQKPIYNSRSFHGGTAYVDGIQPGFWLPVRPLTEWKKDYVLKVYGHRTQQFDVTGNDMFGNYIDHQGRLLIPWKYDSIAPYYPGYVRTVRKNGKFGFLDSLARITVPIIYDDIDADSSHFWQNRRRVGQANTFGFMDVRNGQMLVPLQFSDTKPSRIGVVWIQKNQKWALLNPENQLLTPYRYDEVTPLDDVGRAIVQQNGRWGLADSTGQLLAACQYERIFPFSEGRAAVKQNGKFGFINLQGQESIPTVYDEVSHFKDGKAFAKRWGLFLTLDPDGNWIGYKLQWSTIKILLGFVLAVLAIGLLWRYQTQKRLRRAAA